MSKLRNTEKTDKRGFSHTCYVATATQNLKDFRNSSLWTCLWGDVEPLAPKIPVSDRWGL